jgi:thiamine biosynthesis lipoprotein
VRLLVDRASGLDALRVQALMERLHRALTRFEPDSELSRLNAGAGRDVAVSPALLRAVRAAVWAARASDGLVDPTVVGDLERAGYDRSRDGVAPAALAEALGSAPPRQPAAPRRPARWAGISLDAGRSEIRLPSGVRIDLGGSAKGLAADLAVELLAPHGPCAADLGGDLRVSGVHEVLVPNPLTGMLAEVLELDDDAVATSGIDKRIWWDAGHRPAHHLLDPATQRPAWTGVLSATAKAPTATLAEALAKAAILAGPNAGRSILSRHGGLLITNAGAVLTAPTNVGGQTLTVAENLHVGGQTLNVAENLHVGGQTLDVAEGLA